jgi:hypothetical protein
MRGDKRRVSLPVLRGKLKDPQYLPFWPVPDLVTEEYDHERGRKIYWFYYWRADGRYDVNKFDMCRLEEERQGIERAENSF